MSIQYAKNSPYYKTSTNGSYLDVINFIDIPEVTNDVLFVVTTQYENRPDLLAYDLYGNAGLWWVFAARNKNTIQDPVYDLYAGQEIYLPQTTTLKSILGI